MNRTGPGIITPDLRASIAADLASLVTDGEVRVMVTVTQKRGPSTVDRAAGTITEDVTTSTVSMLRCEVPLREVEVSTGGLQAGDVRFHVLRSALPLPATVADSLVCEGVRYQILELGADPLLLLHTYTARRTP